MENHDYQSSCGKGRRGCCIIQLPHDEQPTMPSSNCDNERNVVLLLQFSDGRPSGWAVVSLPIAETPGELGEAIG